MNAQTKERLWARTKERLWALKWIICTVIGFIVFNAFVYLSYINKDIQLEAISQLPEQQSESEVADPVKPGSRPRSRITELTPMAPSQNTPPFLFGS